VGFSVGVVSENNSEVTLKRISSSERKKLNEIISMENVNKSINV